MNKILPDVISDILTYNGASAEQTDNGVLDIIFTRDLSETLNIPEYARLYFSHETQSDDGIYASYDSEVFSSMAKLFSVKGRFSAVKYEASFQPKIEKLTKSIRKAPSIYVMTGFILYVPAVSGHVLTAVSNTVVLAIAPVLNAGRHINESHKILNEYMVFLKMRSYSVRSAIDTTFYCLTLPYHLQYYYNNQLKNTNEIYNENIYIDLDASGNLVAMTIEHARQQASLPFLSYEQIETGSAKKALQEI